MQRSARRYEFGPFQLNPHEGSLVAAGEPVALAPTPFDVLRVLVERHGHVVLKSELMASIWPDTAVEDANLTVSVSVVRKVLARRQPGSRYIQTVPKRGYRFVGPVEEITDTDENASTAALTPHGSRRVGNDYFVGRHRELMDLEQAATAAANGGALLIGLAGEPGIGKTSLVEEFTKRLRAGRQEWLVARGRCLEHVAGLDPYFCFFEALDALRESTDDAIPLMESCAPSWHARFDTPRRESVPTSVNVPGACPERLRQELNGFLRELARRHPLLLFFDDLHWADESTVALLAFLVHRFAADSARILIAAAYRPSIVAGPHPLLGVTPELRSRGTFREIAVDALSRLEIEQYLSKRFVQHRLSPGLVDAVHKATEGNPLFVVDLVTDLLRRGIVTASDGTWVVARELPDWSYDWPDSVRAMVERTIRQLEVADRSLLSVASVQGHEFDARTLARSVGADPARIEERLDVLRTIHAVVRIEIGHRRGSDDASGTRYSFVHALYREALYASLPHARKVLLSGSVAHALLERHRNHVSDIASTLAVLFETACDGARAAEYALVAARNAAGMSGYHEAVALARRGLRMLESVPPSAEHTYKRLMLLATLAAALGATDGYGTPEVREAYQYARSLCRHSSEWLYLVPTLIGLWSVHASRGEFESARELGRHLLTTSEEADAPGLRARAHVMHGGALAHLGRLVEARAELERARQEYGVHADPCPFILDAGVHTLCERAELLAVMGYADQALKSSDDALALARRLDTPFNLAFALVFGAVIRRRRDEADATLKSADAAIALAKQHEFLDALSWATGLQSWALCRRGCVAEGIAVIDDALVSSRRMGPDVARVPLLAILADAYLNGGLAAKGLATLETAIAADQQIDGDRYCLPELYCLRGDLLRLDGNAVSRQTEECYAGAISIAQSQGARWFELLATTRLCRLQYDRQRSVVSAHRLRALYASFTEGLETPHLTEARALLDLVARSPSKPR